LHLAGDEGARRGEEGGAARGAGRDQGASAAKTLAQKLGRLQPLNKLHSRRNAWANLCVFGRPDNTLVATKTKSLQGWPKLRGLAEHFD
jgi:hypothetical protein